MIRPSPEDDYSDCDPPHRCSEADREQANSIELNGDPASFQAGADGRRLEIAGGVADDRIIVCWNTSAEQPYGHHEHQQPSYPRYSEAASAQSGGRQGIAPTGELARTFVLRSQANLYLTLALAGLK
jgi:hypothetical protein